MKFINYFIFITFLALEINYGLGSPNPHHQITNSNDLAPFLNARSDEPEQAGDAEKPALDETVPNQESVGQSEPIQPTDQQNQAPVQEQESFKPQEPIRQSHEPVKQIHEPVKQIYEPIRYFSEPYDRNRFISINNFGSDRIRIGGGGCCSRCSCRTRPNFKKAFAIAAKGKKIATKATLIVAAPALITSAKVAALAGLIPIKLAAHGAIVGSLIAKPIIIKSVLVGAIATKLSHIFVGKPIKIGAKLLAGAEALKAKIKAEKADCGKPTCGGDSISDI